MAPAARSGRRPQAKATYRSRNTKDSKDYRRKDSSDYDDIASRTTAASLTASPTAASDSDQDWRASCTPSKTSLKSLKNKAKMFVPTEEMDTADLAMMLPPCLPTPGKDCLAGIIQSTLGSELWNLNMMDGMSFSGEWYTAVEITIPELNASMCSLATSGDDEAIKAAQLSNQSQAVESLAQALKGLQPSMELLPADEGAHICVEFCAADRTTLCHEFSHYGSCPRGATCRWAHAMIEVFMINIVLAPLALLGEREVLPAASESNTTGRWQPSRPPMMPSQESLPTVPAETQCSALADSDVKADVVKVETIKPLSPDMRPKNPRLTSQKKWSDIQEESDDDIDCLAERWRLG